MASSRFNFAEAFEALTGNAPFPWQHALHGEFVQGKFRSSCDLPTGLGKTSVIALWLLALAEKPNDVPRRLVYVVNRRTVVDQATDEAVKFRSKLADAGLAGVREALAGRCASRCDPPLAISTLRGQFADNGEWAADPARPAIVVGTVDMIGSRLLFSAYGRGFKSRPLHAGFLGQDVLLVHDEAHLEPAFQKTLEAVQEEQLRSERLRTFHVMELSATSRGGGEPFGLADDDRAHAVVRQRIEAVKLLTPHPEDDEKKLADRIAKLALAHADSGQAILVFVRRLDDLRRVADNLADKLLGKPVLRLTGTIRGKERDELTKHPIFQRFLPESNRAKDVTPQPGTVYLLCTSAGEVGVNISADHLVCDLTTYDSMAQRLGRVNRFGLGSAQVDVVHPTEFDDESALDSRRRKTLELLRQLVEQHGGSASPAALGRLDAAARRAAFAPDPVCRETSDILFDAWALTSVRDDLPGRPPVAEFLHGVADFEPPQTHVAWRLDVELITDDAPLRLLTTYQREDWLDEYPLKPHELLRDSSKRVFEELQKLAADRRSPSSATPEERARIARENADRPGRPVWIVDDKGNITAKSLAEVLDDGVDVIERRTVLLPPNLGGLHENGTLDGTAGHRAALTYDVADEWFEPPAGDDDVRTPDERRLRVRIDSADASPPPHAGMRLILPAIVLREADDESRSPEEGEVTERLWSWYERPAAADGAGSKFARDEQLLDDHLHSAERHAAALADKLNLSGVEAAALILAARWHDLGKRREVWQKSVGNFDRGKTLAKSNKPMRWRDLGGSRHEFGSLLDLLDDKQERFADFRSQPDDVRELTLHLIGAHHGRGRPHFLPIETTDAEHKSTDADRVAADVPRRFARLQRKYGRWGLAWLESLVRAADALASQPDPAEEARP